MCNKPAHSLHIIRLDITPLGKKKEKKNYTGNVLSQYKPTIPLVNCTEYPNKRLALLALSIPAFKLGQSFETLTCTEINLTKMVNTAVFRVVI